MTEAIVPPAPDLTATGLGVLRVLGVRGFADTPVVAEVTGMSELDATTQLTEHAGGGLVARRDGRLTGWYLTPDGRAVLAQALDADRVASGIEPELARAYDAFLALNEPMKRLCTAWQLEGQPGRCVHELAALHADLEPALAALGATSSWFDSYLPRLRAALDRFRTGDPDALTKPLSGSYHDVWMELHQDLLLALGRTRTAADGH